MAGTIVANTLNTDTGLFSTNNAYSGIAKAWVQFSYATGSMVVSTSFNVSSVTRTSTGLFTVNFTTAMPSANYVPAISCASTDSNAISCAQSGQTASALPVLVGQSITIGYIDNKPSVYVTVFSN
jgi:hypothetical protein